ncbi:GNAT family N-acetyltransferase [Ligilactobacillus saerimneri]|uniref:GNAT family N-acetyltransferase n=1 Tax=Ligilactobacillus saerimneri TaxID=228229 RepID=UPI003F2646D6
MDYQWQTDVFTALSPTHEVLGKITYQDMPATTHPTYLITQVWVDPAYRGQGIAGQLTTVFLTDVRQRTGYVIPHCPYAKTFIAKHPEFQDLIAK